MPPCTESTVLRDCAVRDCRLFGLRCAKPQVETFRVGSPRFPIVQNGKICALPGFVRGLGFVRRPDLRRLGFEPLGSASSARRLGFEPPRVCAPGPGFVCAPPGFVPPWVVRRPRALSQIKEKARAEARA